MKGKLPRLRSILVALLLGIDLLIGGDSGFPLTVSLFGILILLYLSIWRYSKRYHFTLSAFNSRLKHVFASFLICMGFLVFLGISDGGAYFNPYRIAQALIVFLIIFSPLIAAEVWYRATSGKRIGDPAAIKQLFPYHHSLSRMLRESDDAGKLKLLSVEDEAVEVSENIMIILRELSMLEIVSPFSIIKPEERVKYAKYFPSDPNQMRFVNIEGSEEKDGFLSITLKTVGSLVPDDLIGGKARSKIYEAFSERGMPVRSLDYDRLSRRLIVQFFLRNDFRSDSIMDIVQKIDFAFTDLGVKNASNLYPSFRSYQVIDKDPGEDGKIYTVKFTYLLPPGLPPSLLSKDKISALSSYVRLPLYEHSLKSHDEILDLYIELHQRDLSVLRFHDFDPPKGLRLPLGFDLKYRKPVFLNFNQYDMDPADNGFAPHYIIAGSTSSGKSNFIRFLILQLLRSHSPDDLRLFLVDPKVVTFNIFKDLPHLYAPVVSDAKKFSIVLNGIIEEVENRYRLFAENGVDNIRTLKQKNPEVAKQMPYIIVIVDEFADIVDSQRWDVKESIVMALKRLGQKARAAGIHMMLITQRATSTNIDGEIKANMPGRIAFRVASDGDSQIIIDDNVAAGVENPGEGYARIGDAQELIHFQSPFISDDEILSEIRKYSGIGQSFLNRGLTAELLKKPLKREEVNPKSLPKGIFPDIPIGINLNSHDVISLSFARKRQEDEEEPTPHLIVAGATNSGKSRFAKLLAHQLIHSGDPESVRLILVDPKMVTFAVFKDMPHLYCPLVDRYEDLLPLLRHVLGLIESRYRAFSEAGAENIEAYRISTSRKMPSIVIIIDEFADLLDSYDYKHRDEIERILKRFGQMARAAGVHLVLITQRATSQNIPGEIRTHFAGRMAFRMNTEADSYYILEEAGAQDIQGAGSFLLKKASNEIVSGYSPLFHREDLAKAVEEMRMLYGEVKYDEWLLNKSEA